MDIQKNTAGFGASIQGVDLSQPLEKEQIDLIRAAWIENSVLSFTGQTLSNSDLEQFTLQFGPFGDDPFIAPIEGHQHVIAVCRDADETTPIFADAWHTDWSFQSTPPAGTCLYSLITPPKGGDTLFANQRLAWEAMSATQKKRYDDLVAIHSAQLAYAPQGVYGDEEAEAQRSMNIQASEDALNVQTHPLIKPHSESGQLSIYGCAGYIIGLHGVEQKEAIELLTELLEWQTQEEFVYRHQWQTGTLLMWDNRSLLHKATGGFEGHARLLHRTTIGA